MPVPIAYRIEPAQRLVWATAHGILTTADFFEYQRAVWSRPEVQDYDELVDMRDVADIPDPSPTGLQALASLSATMDPPGVRSKFAIIASDDFAYGLGRMYQTHRGLKSQGAKEVAVFRTIEAGLEWLGIPQRAVAFEYQPTLRGSLIELRPLQTPDFEALFAVASDPLIWEQHPDKSRSTPQGFRRFFDEAIASGGALLITKAGTGEVIGSSRFQGYSPEAREVEIGWTFLARTYWGGTYNRELKRLMLEHAFRFVDRVIFIIGSHNFRSQRAVLKIGAIQTASRTDGSGAQSLAFCLTPADWAKAVHG